MSITAAEVVRHARPIADLLGITRLADLQDGWVCLLTAHPEADSGLPPDEAAAMILGLIVARIDTTMEMDYVGLMIQQVDSDLMRCATFDSKDRIGSRFKAFCHAFARANGIEPATQTKENP